MRNAGRWDVCTELWCYRVHFDPLCMEKLVLTFIIFSSLLPNASLSQVVVMPGLGHYPHVEDPSGTADVLFKFLEAL